MCQIIIFGENWLTLIFWPKIVIFNRSDFITKTKLWTIKIGLVLEFQVHTWESSKRSYHQCCFGGHKCRLSRWRAWSKWKPYTAFISAKIKNRTLVTRFGQDWTFYDCGWPKHYVCILSATRRSLVRKVSSRQNKGHGWPSFGMKAIFCLHTCRCHVYLTKKEQDVDPHTAL